MIPKIIHYCWFGRKPYPSKVERCMKSWHKMLPDYDFKLWNEDNFNVNTINFTKQAYENHKYAFVSDFVRIFALYSEGGIYLDTDYEIIKPFDDNLLTSDVVLGTDISGNLVALMASVPFHLYFKGLLDIYNNMDFIDNLGILNMTVNNKYMQDELQKYGYKKNNTCQQLSHNISVYSNEYFDARSLLTGKIHKTFNTYTIHWHTTLWGNRKTKMIKFLRMRILIPIIGKNIYNKYISKNREKY